MANPVTILIEQAGIGAGIPGDSRQDLLLNALVTCTDPANFSGGGTWAWSLVTPNGSSTTGSGGATNTFTFTPDILGTYLVYVVYDDGVVVKSYTVDNIGQWVSTQGGGAILDGDSLRYAGFGETTQFGVRGWDPAVDKVLRFATDNAVRNPLILKTGNGVVTAPDGEAAAAIGHGVYGDVGTAEVSVADADAGGMAVGLVNSYAGGTARIRSLSHGCFATGAVTLWGAHTGEIEAGAGAYDYGAHALGHVGCYSGDASIKAGNPGAFAGGEANGSAAGYSADILADGFGAFAFGNAYSDGTTDALIKAHGAGSFACGDAKQGSIKADQRGSVALGFASGDSTIYSRGDGAVAVGYASLGSYIYSKNDGAFSFGRATQTSAIYGDGDGSFACGYARDHGEIVTHQPGAFAIGKAHSYGHIYSNGSGALAGGRSYGVAAVIQTSGDGSLAFGFANTGEINASGAGAVAHGFASSALLRAGGVGGAGAGAFAGGYAKAYDVLAEEDGSFAFGAALTADIQASAINSAQFGEGTNTVPNSLQVGSDFLAKANGQFAGKNDPLTLGAAAVTFVATSNVMTITGDAGANTIATITGGINGQELTLIFVDALVTITDNDAHGANTVDLADSFVSADDVVLKLVFDGTSWYEVGRSTGGVGGVANPLIIKTGDGTVTGPAQASGVFGHGIANTGVADVSVTAGADKSGLAVGWVNSFAGGTARVQTQGKGGFAQGYVGVDGAFTSEIIASGVGAFARGVAQGASSLIEAGGDGSFANGQAVDGAHIQTGTGGDGAVVCGYADGTYAIIEATGLGAFACGRVYETGSTAAYPGTIEAASDGAWAGGRVYASDPVATGGPMILANDYGAMAHGAVVDGQIQANSDGSHVFGYASAYGKLRADGKGAFAVGYITGGGALQASSDGSFAAGHASAGYDITASDVGAFAFGRALTADIEATEPNAFQFGEGTNATANSLQVGSDFMAKANGQFGGVNDPLTLGIAAVTFATTSNVMTITGDAGGNTVATITGGINGQELTLIFVDALVTITDNDAHGANTVDLADSFTSADDVVLKLVFDGTSWYEVGRSTGGVGGVSNPLIVKTGDGTATGPAQASAAIGHGVANTGTADVSVTAGADKSGLAVGWVDSFAGGTARVQVQGEAGFAQGFVDTDGAFIGEITAGDGAHAFGVVAALGANASIKAVGAGAFAGGYVADYSAVAGLIQANYASNFAFGYANGGTLKAGVVKGSIAFGHVDDGGSIHSKGEASFICANVYGTSSYVYASGEGSHLFGCAYGGGYMYAKKKAAGVFAMAKNSGVIKAYGYGAHTFGMCGAPSGQADLQAIGAGAFASGYVYSDNSMVSSNGAGSFAHGYAKTGGYVGAANVGDICMATALGASAYAQANGGSSTCFGRASVGGKLIAGASGSMVCGYADDASSIIETTAQGSFASGYANTAGVIRSTGKGSRAFGIAQGASSLINPQGDGSFAMGQVLDGAHIQTGATGDGAIASGYADGTYAIIEATGPGAFACGHVYEVGSTAVFPGTIEAAAKGAWAGGRVFASDPVATGGPMILANDYGAMAHGAAVDGQIQANSDGSHAFGYASAYGKLTTSGKGAFVAGYVTGASLLDATGAGAFAAGHASASYDITASAAGSFAFGKATTANIAASASNAFQLGEGTNSTANSLQVGSGFSAKANGQFAGVSDPLTLGAAATTFAATSNVMAITGDAGGNTVATITGGISGELLTLIFVDALVAITDTASGANTVNLGAAFTGAAGSVLTLVYDGTSWFEVGRNYISGGLHLSDGQAGVAPHALTAASPTLTDCTKSNVFTLTTTTTGWTMAAPTGMKDGYTYIWIVINGASHTLDWNAAFMWPGGTKPVLTVASGRDVITGVYHATLAKFVCNFVQDIKN